MSDIIDKIKHSNDDILNIIKEGIELLRSLRDEEFELRKKIEMKRMNRDKYTRIKIPDYNLIELSATNENVLEKVVKKIHSDIEFAKTIVKIQNDLYETITKE